MFQYATQYQIYVNTNLITHDEAILLWNKWQDHLKAHWNELDSPQMAIWINCNSNTDYHTMEKDIDYRDCELHNGRFYRVVKTLI